jgi:hypothetical protein
VAVAATQTAVSVEQTATAVALTITPVNADDPDEDGLTNDVEARIGSDPNNRDSDGDGLLDGEEFNDLGTSPTNRDTDGDFLSDWDEINIHRTDPTKADTDGDGLTDGQEITNNTDPLSTAVPTPGPTATPSATATVGPTATQGATATPTQTPFPTLTPTVTNTPMPAATATQTPQPSSTPTVTITPQPTQTFTPEPTATSTPVPISCITTPPTIDGIFQVTEWPVSLRQFASVDNPAARAEVYLTRDVDNLYLAFLINDDSVDASDSLRVLFDTTNNGGDPDSADRFFQVLRDNTQQVSAGIGSNTDTQNWNGNYSSSNWLAVVTQSNSQWVVEMEIDAVEMGALSPVSFGLMVQVLFNSNLATWPEEGELNNPSTWVDVSNIVCTP